MYDTPDSPYCFRPPGASTALGHCMNGQSLRLKRLTPQFVTLGVLCKAFIVGMLGVVAYGPFQRLVAEMADRPSHLRQGPAASNEQPTTTDSLQLHLHVRTWCAMASP